VRRDAVEPRKPPEYRCLRCGFEWAQAELLARSCDRCGGRHVQWTNYETWEVEST